MDKNIWNAKDTNQLATALCKITDPNIMKNFLRDVMTENEIREIATRLNAAIMLTNGNKYDEVVKNTKLSTRTVARISKWLKYGCKGYGEAIRQLENNKHNFTS